MVDCIYVAKNVTEVVCIITFQVLSRDTTYLKCRRKRNESALKFKRHTKLLKKKMRIRIKDKPLAKCSSQRKGKEESFGRKVIHTAIFSLENVVSFFQAPKI